MNWLRDRTPLWLRLIAGVLLLSSVTLLVVGYIGNRLLYDYLVGVAKDRLVTVSKGMSRSQCNSNPSGQSGQRSLPSQYVVQQYDRDGKLLRSCDAPFREDTKPPDLPTLTVAQARDRATQPPVIAVAKGDPDRTWLVTYVIRPHDEYAVVAASLDDVDGTVARLARINAWVALAGLGALAFAVWGLVVLSLRPLRQIQYTAGAIAAGDLSRRVPDRGGHTEIGRLGGAVNGMLARIEAALTARASSEGAARASEERMRRFIAEASHELRTPVTTIRGYADMYRQQRTTLTPDDADHIVGRIEREARRMSVLVEDLLLLAQLDDARPLQREPVDLISLAADVVLDAAALATDRTIDLTLIDGGDDGAHPPVTAAGDATRLRQVLANLVTNARAHTPPGTPVEIRVGRRGPFAVVEVADSGPGLTPAQAARVFERFWRAEPARAGGGGATPTAGATGHATGHQDGTQPGPANGTANGNGATNGDGNGSGATNGTANGSGSGAGLGLAIVAAVVAAHGGTVELDTAPGQGATFRILLPADPPSTQDTENPWAVPALLGTYLLASACPAVLDPLVRHGARLSFGVYLTHPLLLRVFWRYLRLLAAPAAARTAIAFVATVAAATALAALANRTPLSLPLIGRSRYRRQAMPRVPTTSRPGPRSVTLGL